MNRQCATGIQTSGPPRARRRRAFTLVEMMITMVVTLIVVLAIVKLFNYVGDLVAESRATIEMVGQARKVGQSLRVDLSQVSLPVRPWPNEGSGMGYFEYFEGPSRDTRALLSNDTAGGDIDDVIMMTCHSRGEPFVGVLNGAQIESQVAEVIWWTVLDDRDSSGGLTSGDDFKLYRRVLLVRPDRNNANGLLVPGASNQAAFTAFYANNDISVRPSANGLVANSMADLTKRENRFAHNRSGFPFSLNLALLRSLVLSGPRQGEDLVASQVMAFDVKAYDPMAPIQASGNAALVPGDSGWNLSNTAVGRGAYVDLGYSAGGTVLSHFDSSPNGKSKLAGNPLANSATYCTWSRHYERDGVNQDGVLGVDQGTNGLDDNSANGVDDVFERETSPPYPVALRGIQVGIRIIDRSADDYPENQVRHISVNSNFVPE